VEYDKLGDLGMFDDENIELLEGMLVEMSPIGPPHYWITQRLNRALARGLPEELEVRVANPIAASDISEPEPDLLIVPAGDFRHEHPGAALLVIEVAHSSRAKDLGIKARIYAGNGVPAYWVIDVEREIVHIHTEPSGDAYAAVNQHAFTETLDAAGVPITLTELLQP
jgi:Uma2 family endonuclease